MLPDGRTLLEMLFVLGDLALIAGLLLRRERPSWRTLPLALYLLAQTAWALALYGMRFSALFNPAGLAVIAEYAVMVALVALLGATLAMIRSGPRAWLWLILPAALAGVALALDARILGPRDWRIEIGGWVLTQEGLRLIATLLTWASSCGLAIGLMGRARTGASSPLHRNRLRYWIVALALATIGMGTTLGMKVALPDLPPLMGQQSLLGGGAVTLLGSLVAVITWRVYYLPDVRVMLRRTVSYAIITLVTFVIYLLGIQVAQVTFRVQTALEPLFGAVLVAGVLALGYAPLRRGVQWLTRRVLGGAAVDYTTSLQDYSRRITQVLDLEPLAAMVLETARSALGISRGALFLAVDGPLSGLTLQAIGELGVEALGPIECPPSSPITQQWRANGGPLLQYDIDVLPTYRLVSAAEHAALARWKMEILLPIRTMGQLIGVLAVGSKRSRDPYFESDIAYLAALADATGVALQNARLFSELRDANERMADMNRELEHANEQLRELDTLKSGFLGVITHELRSPFAAIDFSVQLIHRYGLDNLLPEQREQLQQLTEGLKRAETMINNLITFASFLSKQGQLRMVPVDLGQLAQEAVKMLEPMAQARDVKLTIEASGLMPKVYGDPDRLGEAIYHLVHNAIKFNRQGGTVTLAYRAAPEDVIFEVSDTGVGIPQDKLPEMWKDFAQLADPLRRGVEGLGLGLPLVKYVTKAHGGQVWARSQPGQGSVFGFRVPLGTHQP